MSSKMLKFAIPCRTAAEGQCNQQGKWSLLMSPVTLSIKISAVTPFEKPLEHSHSSKADENKPGYTLEVISRTRQGLTTATFHHPKTWLYVTEEEVCAQAQNNKKHVWMSKQRIKPNKSRVVLCKAAVAFTLMHHSSDFLISARKLEQNRTPEV